MNLVPFRIRWWLAERLARFADRLVPRPESEDPLYLLARAVHTACVSDDPLAVARELRTIDARTVALMFLTLVQEISHPAQDVLERNGRAIELVRMLEVQRPESDAEARTAAAYEAANMFVLGHSTEASAKWAERRMSTMLVDRLEGEFDA